jgi:cytochrome c-type biogenesis protein CcmE
MRRALPLEDRGATDLSSLDDHVQRRGIPPKFIILGVTLLLVVLYLGYTAMASSAVYYLTVGELLTKGPAATNATVRVGGRMVSGSLQKDSRGDLLFRISDGTDEMPVVFHGVAPDLFGYAADGLYQDGVLEGKMGADGVFQASQIIVKHDANFQSSNGTTPPTSTTPGTLPPKKR